MSNILISGCGISFSKQERPTWINVLKICGLNINDVSGPGISNDTILNALLFELDKDSTITHVICQLTNTGKLDIEMNKDRESMMNNTDDFRRFTWKGLWPSSVSQNPDEKKSYYTLFHSKKIELENLITFPLSDSRDSLVLLPSRVISSGKEIFDLKESKHLTHS